MLFAFHVFLTEHAVFRQRGKQNVGKQADGAVGNVHAVDGKTVVQKRHSDLKDLRVTPLVNTVGDIRIIDGFLFSADAADIGEIYASAEQNGKQKRVFCRCFFIQRRDKAKRNQIGFEFGFTDRVKKDAGGDFFSVKNIMIHIDSNLI